MINATISESVLNYFLTCPLLSEGRLNLDYLGADTVEYVVENVPCDPILTQYTDGGTLRQFLFLFGSREAYGADTLQNIANSRFYEQLAQWLETNSDHRILPALPSPLEAQRLEVISSGYVMEDDTDNARYQMQCRLVYTQPRRL